MLKAELIGISALFLIGIYGSIESRVLRIWVGGGPGEGFFPLALALTLVAISGLSLLKIFLSKSYTSTQKSTLITPVKYRKMIIYSAAILIYALILEPLGYIFSSALVFFSILKFAEREDLLSIIIVTAGTLIFSYLLFEKWLMIPLPKGILLLLW